MYRILNLFSNDFNSIYEHMTGKQRREIAHLAPTVFVRWYYSALFHKTILSPSTIIESQKENRAFGNGFYSICLNLKKFNGNSLDFFFTRNYYSAEDHPIYRDLMILYEFISPALYLNDDLSLTENDIHRLQKRLSISDKYYVEYLFRLGEGLGMYTKMPSLFEPCIQPVAEFRNFFFSDSVSRLKNIVSVSCEICASALNSEFPYDFCAINAETIMSFLENPMSIDDMFISIYSKAGIDLEEIWKRSDDGNMSDMDSAVISSVYYLGILMDKNFIYVFGYYLRLIRPLYSYPLSIRETVNGLFTTIAIDGERELDLFMPCTTYIHTRLGKIFFDPASDSSPKYPPIPMEKIYLSLTAEKQAGQSIPTVPESIYSFRVHLDNDQLLWKKIEFESSTPLKMVFFHLLLMFSLPPKTKYSARVIDKKNKKYLDFNDIGRLSDPSTALSEISFDEGRSLLFLLEGGRSLELRFLKSYIGIPEIIYPRIVSQSKEITENEHHSLSDDYT